MHTLDSKQTLTEGGESDKLPMHGALVLLTQAQQ